MPSVRIVTGFANYPAQLVKDLRARGFEVETSVAKDAEQRAADLEITVDECSANGIADLIENSVNKKDVYIIADPEIKNRKVRTIGMIVLNGHEAPSPNKIALPAHLTEIYTALLRERNAKAQSAIIKSIHAEDSEPDWLSPMAFIPRLLGSCLEAIQQSTRRDIRREMRVGDLPLWKALVPVAVSIIFVVLLFLGVSRSVQSSNSPAPDKKDPVAVQTPPATENVHLAVVPAAEKAVVPVKMKTGKNRGNGDDEYFDHVEVRHIVPEAPGNSVVEKTVPKHRVVVD